MPEECPRGHVAQLIDDCLENPPRERPSARQAYDIIKRCPRTLTAARLLQSHTKCAFFQRTSSHVEVAHARLDMP